MAVKLPPRCAERYEPVRMISAGAFGSVAEAIHRELHRPVALKLLHGTRLTDRNVVRRFLAEARVTASLSHPHIVRVLDHDVEDGVPWIAYELLPGGTLADLIADGPTPWRAACRIIAQVAGALEAAHTAGVLHRDIKGVNVMAADEGAYKVADFGLAKWRSDGTVLTQAGAMLGTPAYIAPEILGGRDATEATDIYATGVLFFELLTGERPYSAKNVATVLAAHIRQPVPSARERHADVPETVDRLVQSMLAKDPAKRPASARTLREALVALAPEGTQTIALGVQLAQEAARAAERRDRTTPCAPARPAWPFVGGALAVCALAAGAALWVGRPAVAPSAPPLTISSPSVPPQSELPLDVRTRVTDALARGRAARAGRSNFADFVGGSLSGAEAFGLVLELAPAREKARAFIDVHAGISRICEGALSELRRAQSGPAEAPLADQILWCDVLADRVVARSQVTRAEAFLSLVAEPGMTMTAALVDARTCIAADVLPMQYEQWSATSCAIAQAARDPASVPGDFAGLVRNLHWTSSYFVSYPVCGMSPDALRTLLRERATQRLRGTAGAPPLEMEMRGLAVELVAIASAGAKPGARAQVPRVTAALRRLGGQLPACRAPLDDLVNRVEECAGQ